MTVAPAGTMAWRRLLSGISRRSWANRSRITSATASSSSSSTPITRGDGFPGHVVVGRSEAAADDQRVGIDEKLAEDLLDPFDVVADLDLQP